MNIAVLPQYSTCKLFANVQKSDIAKLLFHLMKIAKRCPKVYLQNTLLI